MNLENDSYERILENLHDGLYFVDRDRTITYWNNAAEQISGFTAIEVVGKSCSDNILTKIVFLSRLLPVVSFDVVSYGAGLTNMSLKKFSAATFLGMIPLTFLYNYSGSVLVFGSGLSFVLGILMVVLFFVVPKWLEDKGFLKKMGHE